MRPPRTGPHPATAPPEPLGFGWRLGAALGLVVVAGAVTLLTVALLVAPQVFQEHLQRVLTSDVEPAVQAHVDEAFAEALLSSLGVAVPVALLTAFAMTWVVARRLSRSVAALAAGAGQIAAGDLHSRVASPAIGPEFARLTSAFNSMADRLAETERTRSRLIGDLAHELRTPLASLEATIDAVSDGVLPPDTTTMATLHEQTDRLGRLVADMSAVSRAEERRLVLSRRPLALGDLARRVVAAHEARFAAAGGFLRLEVADDVPEVVLDPDRLGEALDNLLDNALRHGPAGGVVTVRVRASGRGAALDVIDAGAGFAPDDGDRIFERFYRADASRTGAHSGVGLTIARAIVEAHDGTLTAASPGPGRGATFTIELPGAAGSAR